MITENIMLKKYKERKKTSKVYDIKQLYSHLWKIFEDWEKREYKAKERNMEIDFWLSILSFDYDSLCVYYLTNDHEYNWRLDKTLKMFWYKRCSLYKEAFLVDNYNWLPFKRWGRYYRKEQDEKLSLDKARRDNIRKAPILWEQTPEEKLAEWEQPLFD